LSQKQIVQAPPTITSRCSDMKCPQRSHGLSVLCFIGYISSNSSLVIHLIGFMLSFSIFTVRMAGATNQYFARVQDVLDDAWIRLSPDAEEALKEALA